MAFKGKYKKKGGKNNFNIKSEYKKSLNYIKESKNFIYYIILIFLIFSLIGFFVPAPEIFKEKLLQLIKELAEKTQGMSYFELFGFIFLNNLRSSFFGIILGALFGIFPIIASISNGYLIGFVSRLTTKEEGILVLWRLLPHGIFELPAVFISFGIGLKLGTFIFQKEKIKSFNNYFLNSVKIFIFIIMPLLIIAALIESALITFIG